ncbi:MAG TPA: peptidylprolyl isomerase [Dongiaceae bacterium]|jgi:cyclophilin family peptidyl-prolyl cis-trans isomerase|nr:peptidylprolyl isomerase [Dongiaceae bacterium]
MKSRWSFRLVVLLALLLAAGPGRAGTLVKIVSSLGEIDVELYDQDKPATVQNFLRLIAAGAYQNGFFHRCVPGFVVQGGGFDVFNPSSPDIFGPPWAYLYSVPNFGNVTNEYDVGKFYSNVYGTIAMAKGTNANSATSQFFFNLADNHVSLDNTNNAGGFTVFGHVVHGTNVLNQFNLISKGDNLVDLRDTFGATNTIASVFNTLPTFAPGTNAPPYNKLVYFGASLVQLNIEPDTSTNGNNVIYWNSVYGVTNQLEYAPSPAGPWQVLDGGLGTGDTMGLSAPATNAARFYRVRMDF